MQEEITDYRTVEKDRLVKEVVTDYETEEVTYTILRCDICQKKLGDVDDPDPHAKMAVNPSIENFRHDITSYDELVDAMQRATLDAINTANLYDQSTINFDGWTITVHENPTFEDFSTYGIDFQNTASIQRTNPPKTDKLMLVVNDDIKDQIRRINFNKFFDIPNPEIECDVSLDVCPSCAEDMGASVDQGNAKLTERTKEIFYRSSNREKMAVNPSNNREESEESDNDPHITSKGYIFLTGMMAISSLLTLFNTGFIAVIFMAFWIAILHFGIKNDIVKYLYPK